VNPPSVVGFETWNSPGHFGAWVLSLRYPLSHKRVC
jgi:hypothetical protein